MKLHLVDTETINFPEAYGITPERQLELSKQLDIMVQAWTLPGRLNVIRTSHIIRDIAVFCNGPEELAYCVILHMGWHQKRGMQLAPAMPAKHKEDGKMEFMIGLTPSDMLELQQGRQLHINPKDAGLDDLPITIFLGVDDEKMDGALKNIHGLVYKIVDSHEGDKK